jgi:hypothetical protein
LTTLNDPTWVEAARVLAEHSLKAQPDLDARLSYAFRQVAARPITERDLTALRRTFERQAAIYRTDADAAKNLLSVGASKRDETLNPTDHAAMTAVCLAILNLDEAMTRE